MKKTSIPHASMRRLMLVTGFTLAALATGPLPAGAGGGLPAESLETGTLGPAVSSGTLDHARGGFMVNDASLSGVLSDNSVTFGAGSRVTNTNVLGGNAFQNATGVVNVVQNNGNNVLIQNMVQLNLQFRK